VRLAIIAIPKRMPDAVAALDLNYCALLATLLTLTAGLVVDAPRANRRSLAFFAVPPQVGAEVGHVWIVSRGPSRIKRTKYSVSPWNRSIRCRLCRLPETSDTFGSQSLRCWTPFESWSARPSYFGAAETCESPGPV
jgi:hypothetical protein